MSRDFLLWAFVLAKIPALYDTIISAKSELYSVSGRPLHVPNTGALAWVEVPARACHDFLLQLTKVPQAHGGIVACR